MVQYPVQVFYFCQNYLSLYYKLDFYTRRLPTSELAGSFEITIRTFPGKTLAQMDSLVRVSLTQFEKRGVTDDDIKKFKAGFETRMVNSLSSVKGKGTLLAANQTFTGNANYITKEIERYNKV